MEWNKYPENKPPLNEFVEVIYRDGNRITDLNREFAAYSQDNNEEFYWTQEGMDERDWSVNGFPIIFWKRMSVDHLGRRPLLSNDKRGNLVVVMSKEST